MFYVIKYIKYGYKTITIKQGREISKWVGKNYTYILVYITSISLTSLI